MALEANIGGDGKLFVGEDKTLYLEILDKPPEEGGVPVDVAAFTIQLVVRTSEGAADPPVLDKAATVSGTYNATRSANTQRASVALTDTELGALSAKIYRHSWKRTDDGSETVIAFGKFQLQLATQH